MESSEIFSQRSNNGLNLKATELRLGLPGSESPERDNDLLEEKNAYSLCMLNSLFSGAKRGFSDAIDMRKSSNQQGSVAKDQTNPLNEKKKSQISGSAAKEQVVGWPPIRSFRKNSMATQSQKNDNDDVEAKSGCLYVKVSMDGAPYLRKVDLKIFGTYKELSSALEKMFSCFTISQFGSHGVFGQGNVCESRLMDLLHGSEYVLTYEDKDGDWMLVGDVPWNTKSHGKVQKSQLAILESSSLFCLCIILHMES
ncbi:auxin-responsive protein IAA27 isoform X2 [Medicago truncatula]|uniref:auxin-responsive protein IAA27 isoform X2 n=1 Tax=Medicago truncatula TaxID=3880 RepID=UPI0019680B9D|nr:auxin-responsive protein IAA27 isoform X2 [Medicago truncatula]